MMDTTPFLLAAAIGLLGAGCDPGVDDAAADAAVPDAAPRLCTQEPVDDADGTPTGFAVCDGPSFDRIASLTCPANIEAEHYQRCGEARGMCGVDADCGDPGARCVQEFLDCRCHRFCTVDTDCGPNQACFCRANLPIDDMGWQWRLSSLSECKPANCRTAVDCGGQPCGVSIVGCGVVTGLFCRTTADACDTDDDCPTPGEGCAYDEGEGRWRCLDVTGDCE